MNNRVWLGGFVLSASAATFAIACGDDDTVANTSSSSSGGTSSSSGTSGSTTSSSGTSGSTTSSSSSGDGGDVVTDAGDTSPVLVARSTTRLINAINPYGLVFATDNTLFASGSVIDEGRVRKIAVWRFTADGKIDTTFGTGGLVSMEIPGATGLANGASSFDMVEVTPNDFVVQAVGAGKVWLTKLTVSGNTGTFGTPTEVKFSWADGWPGTPTAPTATPSYGSWSIGVDRSDAAAPKIVVFAFGPAAKVATGDQRYDNDRWIARVNNDATFTPDTTFNATGVVSVDGDGKAKGDNGRRGFVAADGTIYSSGYANIGGNKVIIIKVKKDGSLDPAFNFGTTEGALETSTTAFARPGQVRVQPFTGTNPGAEAYNVVQQSGGRFVTTGYGTSNFDTATSHPDLVSVGFKPDGLDATYGRQGAVAIQSELDKGAGAGVNGFEERGRDMALLPDDRIVHAGAYDMHAALYITSKDGALDKTSGEDGVIKYSFPGNFFRVIASKDGKRIVATSAGLQQTTDAGSIDAGTNTDSILVTVDVAR